MIEKMGDIVKRTYEALRNGAEGHTVREIVPVKNGFDRAKYDEQKFLRNEVASWRLFKRFNSDWFIDRHGSMLHVSGYLIPHVRVDEDDWILHLMGKVWFDANTFVPAYFAALKRHGNHTVNVRTAY